MVYIIGQMVKNMMVCGMMVNKMVKDYSYLQMEHKNMVFGKMVKELDGQKYQHELFQKEIMKIYIYILEQFMKKFEIFF